MARVAHWLVITKDGLTPRECGPFESRVDAEGAAYDHYLERLPQGEEAETWLLWDETMGEGYHAGADGFTYTIVTRKP